MSPDDLIAFESRIKQLWESGDLPSLTHLSGGNENFLSKIFETVRSMPGEKWIFSTHRNHYHALLSGHDPGSLEQKIKDGRSMFIYNNPRNQPGEQANPLPFFCSAVLAGTCCIAAGVALAMKNADAPGWVWCFIGDGGEENGHFYEAATFVEAHNLPCTFVIEDNDRSVDTPRADRRGAAPGLEKLFKCVLRYNYVPNYPHAGSGCSHQITFKQEAIDQMKGRPKLQKSFMETLEAYPNHDAFHSATTIGVADPDAIKKLCPPQS